MSYRLKIVHNQQYVMLGIEDFDKAQLEAVAAAEQEKADVVIINEENDDLLATAVYNQCDDIRLSLSTLGIKDSPWL